MQPMTAMRLRALATGIMPVAAVVLWGRLGMADCTKDTDCKGDRICTKGACIAPPPAQTSCTKDVDCAGQDVCTNQRCGPAPPAAVAPVAPAAPVVPVAAPVAPQAAVAVAGAPSPADPTGRMVAVRFVTPKPTTIAANGKSCVSPCTLQLDNHSSPIVDAGRFGTFPVTVEGPSEVQVKRHGPGGLIFGAVLTGVGLSALFGGLAWLASYQSCKVDAGAYSDEICGDGIGPVLTTTLGGTFAVIGIVGVIAGALDLKKYSPSIHPLVNGASLSSRFTFGAVPARGGARLAASLVF